MVILTHVFFQNILEMPTVPTLHLVPSRKIPTCSTSSGDSSVSNLMLMDRGLASDMQCVKAELGPAEFPTGTCAVLVPGAGAELAVGGEGGGGQRQG